MVANANLLLRPLEEGDFDKGFLTLLSQLTVVGEISRELFTERLQFIRSKGADYYVAVLEDLDKQQIVASATVFIEYKILRQCGKVCMLCGTAAQHISHHCMPVASAGWTC